MLKATLLFSPNRQPGSDLTPTTLVKAALGVVKSELRYPQDRKVSFVTRPSDLVENLQAFLSDPVRIIFLSGKWNND